MSRGYSKGTDVIFGIGVDTTSIARAQTLLDHHGDVAWDRLLTPQERRFYSQRADRSRSFAKVWACKEAMLKALGGAWRGFSWHQLEVVHNLSGQPQGRLNADGALLGEIALDQLTLHLSVSDDIDVVVAFCVAEVRSRGAG